MLMARLSANQKLGKRIRHFRTEACLTQEKLSLITGLSQTYLSGVENGKRNPSMKTLVKIAKALHVSVGDLADIDSYLISDKSRVTRH